jgi:hypothetical protein
MGEYFVIMLGASRSVKKEDFKKRGNINHSRNDLRVLYYKNLTLAAGTDRNI